MKLQFDDATLAFRDEFLAWLEKNRPAAEEMETDPAVSSAHAPDWARRWARRMFDAGWLVPGWAPELGGRNAGAVETLVYLEALTEAGVPRTTNPQGLGIISPSILDYGRPDQVEEFAMPVLRGELTACLGMSEPDAGSDLANLKTAAVRDGDEWVLNGQKVWTSGAAYADFCFLFCRTDPDARKHRGISIILVPMDTPGLEVKPLKEIVHPDTPDLAEVFLDDVRVPIENLVGEENDGWRMANGSLAHERSMVWLDSVLAIERSMAGLLDHAKAWMPALTPAERALAADDVVRLYIETKALRALGYRGFARFVKGGNAPEQALMKAYSSETSRDLARIASEWNGTDALHTTSGRSNRRRAIGGIEGYFNTFGSTISAGSSEIQRNIIAERVLGLPRE
ncbi:MAG: acyl-CoA dehydrogenase [Deltaproteobacteria bacterium]|nr:acyl-CoA dehydrogenase [Deltaproteobacteria bacterium]